MRLKDAKKILSYISRIMKNPFSKQSRSAIKRYVRESGAIINEKYRGLDFTMVYQCENNKHNNNYSKSPERVLRKIFDYIDFSKEHSFIDMGCGKGYVMAIASEYGFEKVAGVEYTTELCQICKKNLEVLHINKAEIFNCDAKEFEKYSEYDCFYFCNPFDETILSVVAKKIFDSHTENKVYIYYLNPHQEERQKAILDAGFKLECVIKDGSEEYFDINIYTN